MERHRFNISVPFEPTRSEESCIETSQQIIEEIKQNVLEILIRNGYNKEDAHMLVWLSFDTDRTTKNYLVKTENGHATKAKTRIDYND